MQKRVLKSGLTYEEEIAEAKRLKTICLKCGFASNRFWPVCPQCWHFEGVMWYRPILVGFWMLVIAWGGVAAIIGILLYAGRGLPMVAYGIGSGVGVTLVYIIFVVFPCYKRSWRERLKGYRMWKDEFGAD